MLLPVADPKLNEEAQLERDLDYTKKRIDHTKRLVRDGHPEIADQAKSDLVEMVDMYETLQRLQGQPGPARAA